MSKNRTIPLSFTVTYDVELEGAQCGNCGQHTPDPPRERLEYVVKEHYKKNRFLHPETVLAKTFVLKAGPNQWADWLPEGWTAGQHAKVPLMCPRCTAAIVIALANAKSASHDLDKHECRTCGEPARLCHCLINGRTPAWVSKPASKIESLIKKAHDAGYASIGIADDLEKKTDDEA